MSFNWHIYKRFVFCPHIYWKNMIWILKSFWLIFVDVRKYILFKLNRNYFKWNIFYFKNSLLIIHRINIYLLDIHRVSCPSSIYLLPTIYKKLYSFKLFRIDWVTARLYKVRIEFSWIELYIIRKLKAYIHSPIYADLTFSYATHFFHIRLSYGKKCILSPTLFL